jgi:hypothetical protein
MFSSARTLRRHPAAGSGRRLCPLLSAWASPCSCPSSSSVAALSHTGRRRSLSLAHHPTLSPRSLGHASSTPLSLSRSPSLSRPNLELFRRSLSLSRSSPPSLTSPSLPPSLPPTFPLSPRSHRSCVRALSSLFLICTVVLWRITELCTPLSSLYRPSY